MLPASDPPLIQENEVWGFFLAKSQAPTLTKHSLPLSAFFFFFFGVRVCIKAEKPGFYQRPESAFVSL